MAARPTHRLCSRSHRSATLSGFGEDQDKLDKLGGRRNRPGQCCEVDQAGGQQDSALLALGGLVYLLPDEKADDDMCVARNWRQWPSAICLTGAVVLQDKCKLNLDTYDEPSRGATNDLYAT